MRLLMFALSILLAVTTVTAVTVPFKHVKSLRHRLMEAGKWKEYLNLKKQMDTVPMDSKPFIQPVIDLDDMIYLAKITLGNPGQEFEVVLDTGSANLWVPDNSCHPEKPPKLDKIYSNQEEDCPDYCAQLPSDACELICGKSCCDDMKKLHLSKKMNSLLDTVRGPNVNPCEKKHKFDSGKSSSYAANGTTWKLSYGTGSAAGFFGADTVCFTPSTLCVKSQTFGQAETLAPFFADQPIDGILGLAFPSIAVGHVTPPFISAVEQGLLEHPVFTVIMSHSGPTEKDEGGWFTYGGYDNEHCEDEVFWRPLTSATFWEFQLDGVGDYDVEAPSQAVSDTGTSLISGPPEIISEIAKQVNAVYDDEEGSYFIDCNSTPEPVALKVAGKELLIHSRDYILPVGENKCQFGFFVFNTGPKGPKWILGDPFLRSYCNVHDVKNKRIGFAKPKKF